MTPLIWFYVGLLVMFVISASIVGRE